MHFFESVESAPPDPILGINISFAADSRPHKVNLGAGVYKTTDLKPLILPVVKKAEALLFETESSKDYLAIDGMPEYVASTRHLVFGKESNDERIYGTQAVGGSGALRVGAAFLKEIGFSQVFISDPSWDNHQRIFTHAGLNVSFYSYYDSKHHRFDYETVLANVKKMPKGSVIVLQACCHNPTGFDPSRDEWKVILETVKQRGLFPFFDFAYQGFGEGIETDAASIRLCLEQEGEFAVAVSHSKNFGLYAERTGALFLMCRQPQEAKRVGSRIKIVVRGLYSNPPCHGARIVHTVLSNPDLRSTWELQVQAMSERIVEMRSLLAAELRARLGSSQFDFLTRQRGMFSYTGLTQEQVDRLIGEYGIYLPRDGRINVAGLNAKSIGYVADAMIATFNR